MDVVRAGAQVSADESCSHAQFVRRVSPQRSVHHKRRQTPVDVHVIAGVFILPKNAASLATC
jgi:hypothetical protein